ncbi:hypothetical protein M885DRAFT_491593 [Pelagophyceae sp. CCMP2097]|nr:hypothetical protein M885DRAFT_491593 [Pelagophyceae sp. CCMP2097]
MLAPSGKMGVAVLIALAWCFESGGGLAVPRRRVVCHASAAAPLPSPGSRLADLVSGEASSGRGKKFTDAEAAELRAAVEAFEMASPAPARTDVSGRWKLLATLAPRTSGNPGAADANTVPIFSVESWRSYIGGDGPSPVQSLFTGATFVASLEQKLTLGATVADSRFDNIVEFSVGPARGSLVIRADLEEEMEGNRLTFRFKRGRFILDAIWGGRIVLPYPVPFALLGDRAVGWLETTAFDAELGVRVARGNKGTLFVFEQVTVAAVEDRIAVADREEQKRVRPEGTEEELNRGCSKRPVILCPAQFGGPADYVAFQATLRSYGHPVYVCDLGLFDWLTIARSVFTEAYWKGQLEPQKALPFYYDAITAAVGRMEKANGGEPREYAILAHSIGGWIARAWLGEAEQTPSTCKAFVTLGTPHLPPPDGTPWASVDQTRGLLNYVNAKWPGASSDAVAYTCVVSTAVQGVPPWAKAPASGASKFDAFLGFASYLPLGGDGAARGDGITPIDCAQLPGADAITLDKNCYHAEFLPNPLGAATQLLGAPWYGAPKENVDAWIEALSKSK